MATKHTVCNANLQTIGENMDDIICIILIIYGGINLIMTHLLIDVESLLWLHLLHLYAALCERHLDLYQWCQLNLVTTLAIFNESKPEDHFDVDNKCTSWSEAGMQCMVFKLILANVGLKIRYTI